MRGFVSILETEIHRSRRYAENLSLCLMGIEQEVADAKMSFEIKDRNFRLLGQTLSKLIRRSDYLGRLDAETFALLMPQTSTQEAEPVCNRLRNLLREKNFETDGIRMNVKLSIVGIDFESREMSEDVLKRARQGLVL
jgi:diguanylate cyclase